MSNEEKAALIEAAKTTVSNQVSKRENNKAMYFESTLANGTIFEIGKDSLPIAKDYAGHEYYTLMTTTGQEIVLSKLSANSVDKVFELIGKRNFKLRADLMSEIPAYSRKDGSKYLKRIFEYAVID